MMDTNLNGMSRVAAHCGYDGDSATGASKFRVESEKDLIGNGKAGAIQLISAFELWEGNEMICLRIGMPLGEGMDRQKTCR